MSRQSKKTMFSLDPVITDTKIKIDKVSISHEKSGSSKIRFTYGGKTFSHGVGRLDNDLYRDKVISICKQITLDLRLSKFDPDQWKMTYFGIDSQSKVVNFPNSQNTNSKSTPIKSELTLIDVWENYLKVKGDRLSYNTLNTSVKNVSNRIDYAVSIDSDCVYLDNIESFVDIFKSKYSDTTLLKDFSLLSSAFNIAMTQGKIKGNPFSLYVDNLAQSPKNGLGLVMSFTKDEKDKIIKTFYDNPYKLYCSHYYLKDGTHKICSRRDSKELAAYFAPMIEFKFLTGVRPGECHGVKWSDILDKNEPVIRISKSASYDGKKLGPTKNKVVRKIPINNALADLIDRLPRIPNKENMIFPSVTSLPYLPTKSKSGTPSRVFSDIVNGLFDDGLIENNLTYYCTRHYFATHLIRANLDIATVASWLGDKQSTVMDFYYAADQSMTIPDIL